MSESQAFIARALYDTQFQAALRRFFPRAVLEIERSADDGAPDEGLAIEASGDPARLVLCLFGRRHMLRAPDAQPFSEHESRLARAIATVLDARYRAIFDPRLMALRSDLFQGSIEDRYIGAFLDEPAYRIDTEQARADRIAGAIEVLRSAALSSYENRHISSGVLWLDDDCDPCAQGPGLAGEVPYSQALSAVKSFYRLCDGLRTVLLVDRRGRILDVVDIARWALASGGASHPTALCAEGFRPHASATSGSRHVCVVLGPTHEIKVFAEGTQVFSFRHGNWHLLDLAAKYATWSAAVQDDALAAPLFQAALDLADARKGALFVVLRDVARGTAALLGPDAAPTGVGHANGNGAPTRRNLLSVVMRRNVKEIDRTVLEAVATLDGATVVDPGGRLVAVGAILRHVTADDPMTDVQEGARTTAAIAASQFGPVLKVSEDGIVTFYDGRRVWDI
jgi:hypothetical protein